MVLDVFPRRFNALLCAWIVEIIAVSMGLTLAVFAGIEGSDGGMFAVLIAMLPFVMLSVIELTKIPFVALLFGVDSARWRLLALFGLACVTTATFGNFVFGFERGFNERIRAVQTAEQVALDSQRAVDLDSDHVATLVARQTEINNRLAVLGAETDAIRQQSFAAIRDARASGTTASLSAELAEVDQASRALDARESDQLDRESIRCHRIAGPCRTWAIHQSFRQQRETLNRQYATLTDQLKSLQSDSSLTISATQSRRDLDLALRDREHQALETGLTRLRADLAAAQGKVLQDGEALAAAERTRDVRLDRSQLHRLAGILFGDQSPVTVERTKKLFVVSLAAIVAVIGSVIAAMHFAGQRAATPQRRPLANALRLYLARKRRRLPILRDFREELRQRHALMRNLRGWLLRRRRELLPVVVKTEIHEVEVPVDRLKLVFVPLNATEEQIAGIRRDHGVEAA
jgi:hypothetical protein